MEEVKLLDYILEYGDSKAIVHRDTVYTYNDLIAKISFWDDKLSAIKNPGVIGVESDFSLDSIALIFSLIKRNFIIAPLDIKQKQKNQEKYVIAELDYLITIDSKGQFDIQETGGSTTKNQFYQKLHAENAPGLVLFTSGSSGKPKAAVHDLNKLLRKFNKKRRTFITVNFLLFDHWGGLNTMFHILANGGLLVLLEDRSPDYVCGLIDKYGVELLPTSPTFLNMLVISRAYQRYSLKSLKLITYGSEPMPENLLTMLNRFFPDIQLQQTYGLIELGVLSSKSESNNSLWVKIGGDGYSVRVKDGLLEIKADSAMLGYINAPSPYTQDGWFMTGDAVEVNGDYFRILGRKSELINVGGEKVYPQEVENVILEHEDVLDVFIYGEPNPLTGKMVCAKVAVKEGVDHKEVVQSIKKLCRSKLASFKIPMKIMITNEALHGDRFKKLRV
jgi:long-chain acyl-CoA synthetase